MPLFTLNIHDKFKLQAAICYLIFVFCLILNPQLFAQGLKFVGSEQSIDKRSSLEVFNPKKPAFREQFSISFDLQISSNSPIGYILRIKEESQKPIINLYYDEENNKAIFRLNEEGKYGLITSSINREKLTEQSWIPVKLNFDLVNEEITLKIGDFQEQKTKLKISSPYSPTIIFGKSDYMIDVPSMSIRNLKVGNKEMEYMFPFKESEGNLLHDSTGQILGKVKNGIWLTNNAFNWKRMIQIQSSTESGSEYNPKSKSVYYFNRDSIQIYHIASGEIQKLKFPEPCPVRLHRGNTFIDSAANKLYVYETFYSTPYNGPTIASLDLNTFKWTVESNEYYNGEINHHAYLFIPEKQDLMIFGGFGDMRYSNEFSVYSIAQKKWQRKFQMSGFKIFPRYFTSMGYSDKLKKAFIFGGMGNESGEHIVGRRYFYDLYSFDPKTNKIEKLWDLDWKEKPFVPARGLVIPDSNYVYLLGYPEHMTHSFIKLRRFSLKDGEYEQLGDSIPIYSDKISTRAKLYYDDTLKKLVSIVQESDDDIRSTLSIYSIDFPAISYEELHSFPSIKTKKSLIPYLFAGIALFLIAGFLSVKYARKARKPSLILDTEDEKTITKALPKTNCIYLFGDFTVLNHQGMDVSHLFSARLKQVFCLILFHSKENGISSKLLSHLLWPDKPKDKVKTSRGVAINNLRKVMSELDDVEIVYEDGHFRVLFNAECYCDYHELIKQLDQNPTELSQDFYKIIERGQFLMGIDDPIFDQVKTDLENKLVDVLQLELKNQLTTKQYTQAIQAAEAILNIDPINEFALEKTLFALQTLKNESKAKRIYHRFIEQYELTMGEKYKHPFEDFWKNQ